MSTAAARNSESSGQPSRPSEARQRILRAVDQLFYNEGIHAVGVHRILEEAGVTRVTFYRHFSSKETVISAYLDGRAEFDRHQILGLVDASPENPRRVLSELATVLTANDFADMRRGCAFVNSAAEFTGTHTTRVHAREHRAWVTSIVEELLTRIGHATPTSTAQQLMMLRTGAVISGAVDDNPHLVPDFLTAWERLIDDGT